MNTIRRFTFFFLCLSLMSCSTGGSGNGSHEATAHLAPASISGKTYRIIPESGSGKLEATGSFTVAFLSGQPWYTTRGDRVEFRNSFGIYSYSANGSSGTIKMEDASISTTLVSFTFNTDTSGTLVATSLTDENTSLTGSFTEL